MNPPIAIDFDLIWQFPGDSEEITGRVDLGDPLRHADYRVAVFAFIPGYGWYLRGLVPIRSHGTFSCVITAAGGDRASRVAAFVLPAWYEPSCVVGSPCLPNLNHHSVAQIEAPRALDLEEATSISASAI